LGKYFQPTIRKDSKKEAEYFSFPESESELFEDAYTFEKKASAPENLPVSNDESIFTLKYKRKSTES